MRTIAFFNNKGGVGKTTLTYHLANMFPRIGFPTLAVDLDPQANLTSAFLDEDRLEKLWDGQKATMLAYIRPILEGTGDILSPQPLPAGVGLSLLAGDLGLSRFEDRLSDAWPRGYENDPAALRATSAFYRLILQGGSLMDAAVALVDIGPNLGAINRAALLAADYIVIPLAADLFSLQGLKNLGPTLRDWKRNWGQVRDRVSISIDLPPGEMKPIGYVVLQHAVRLDRPARAYARWLERIPTVYREAVLGEQTPVEDTTDDVNRLGTIRNYRSLMPMSQDARKPMFDLLPADGAIGSHAQLVQVCYNDFKTLAGVIAHACGLTRAERAVGQSAQ